MCASEPPSRGPDLDEAADWTEAAREFSDGPSTTEIPAETMNQIVEGRLR